jgi:hypothetical protein
LSSSNTVMPWVTDQEEFENTRSFSKSIRDCK